MLRIRLYTEDGFGGENVGIAAHATGRAVLNVRQCASYLFYPAARTFQVAALF